MAGAGGTGRALLSHSFSSPSSSSSTILLFRSLFSAKLPFRRLRLPSLSATIATASTPTTIADAPVQSLRHSILLDRIRSRHLKDATSSSDPTVSPPRGGTNEVAHGGEKGKKKVGVAASSFSELGLSEEVMGALKEMGISVPTEIQCIGVSAVLERKNVVLGSHTGSGKTLAYMLPLVQDISDLNRLIIGFAKVGDLTSAKELFDKMIERDVVSWNSMMSAYSHVGQHVQVLYNFSAMHEQGVRPSHTSFSIVLSSCARFRCLTYGELIHSLSIKSGSSTNEFVGTSLITMYSECNTSDCLMKVFNDFEHRNVASWNALLSGFLLNGLVKDAREIFNCMPRKNVVSWTAMIQGYVGIKKIGSALELFNLMPVANSVTWSVVLGGFVSDGQYEEALVLFKDMLNSGIKASAAIIMKVVSACSGLKNPKLGKKLHGYVIKLGFCLDPRIESALVTMYFRCLSSLEARLEFNKMDGKLVGSWNSLINGYINKNEVDEARKWFDKMAERDTISWNLMINGYLRFNRMDDALKFFMLFPEPTIEAYTGLISAFIENGKVEKARKLFDVMPERDVTSYTAMIYGHLEEGSLNEALELFFKMPMRNTVTCNVMISGLMHHGKTKQAYWIFKEFCERDVNACNALIVGFAQNKVYSKALLLFHRMILSGMSPNGSTIACILRASANLSALKYGESVHGAAIKYGFESGFTVMNSLISMYAKSGNMSKARLVFDQMDEHDLVTWNTLIYGYGVNGFAMESIAVFKKMYETRIKPDSITYLGVLSACMHNCLLEQAQYYFERMKCNDGIEPNLSHYACIIDLLCRKGFIEKAEHMINLMPFEPDSVIWTSVLSGCRLNCNIKIAEHAAMQLSRLIPEDPMPYLHLTDVYRSAGKWTELEQLKIQMNKLEINKKPGFSWTDMNRNDEALRGRSLKPRRPRAVVLCPTRELCEQVFRVAKSISHHARFRSTMISGGGRLRPQEDSLNIPTDMVVGTPGRILQHIEVGNMVFGDIKYLVLDEADTMFDHGFGPDIRKFLGPLKARASKLNDPGFQIVLVAATMTKAVQKLVDEEFQGIKHLRTSSLHKKVASARHDFIKLSASENKLEALLQVLEPSLARGNRVMVFCNTLNSSRAVDHFLAENQIFTVNYHGEVPAEQRVENLKKFKSDAGDCPTLVCTDLAARGLDLDVDHVIMFDFPLNSIDYLHRTGRTARMGAKGKVTSFVDKKDSVLASRIEEAIRKNESFEMLNAGNVRRDAANSRQSDQKGKYSNSKRDTVPSKRMSSTSSSSTSGRRAALISSRKAVTVGRRKQSTSKSGKVTSSKPTKAFANVSKGKTTKEMNVFGNRKSASLRLEQSKLSVVGFRGRSSSIKEASRTN